MAQVTMKVDPAISNLSSGLVTFFNTATSGSMAGLSSADTCIDYTNNVDFGFKMSQHKIGKTEILL